MNISEEISTRVNRNLTDRLGGLESRLVETMSEDGVKMAKRHMLSKYTAALAVNFTDWIGKTYLWTRSLEAQLALMDILNQEQTNDRIGALHRLAKQCQAMPHEEHFTAVEEKVSAVRHLLMDIQTVGISGLAVIAILENASEVFMPTLESWAISLGCIDFEYFEAKEKPNGKHASSLLNGLEIELSRNYRNLEQLLSTAEAHSLRLLSSIFSI